VLDQNQIQAPTANDHPAYLYYLDKLKITVILIVVFYHATIAWAETSIWWPIKSEQEIAWLKNLIAVDEAFFMGLFFLISAYFHRPSLERKGPKKFLNTRLKRLGIPLLIQLIFISPFLTYAYYLNFRNYGPIPFWKYYLTIYWGMSSTPPFFPHSPPHWGGPNWPDAQFVHLWFIEILLLFGCIYVILHLIAKKLNIAPKKQMRNSPLSNWSVHLGLVGYIVFLAITNYIVRIWHPIHEWDAICATIQIEYAHLPEYASLFIIGLLAYRYNWLARTPKKAGFIWLSIGILLAVIIYTELLVSYIPITPGGKSSEALIYAAYESLLGSSLTVGLLVLFREKFSTRPGLIGKKLSENAYCIYLIHVPIVITLQYFFIKTNLPESLQLGLTGLFALSASFIISHYCLRRIRCVKAILG
jgi:glucan biosynthesis protein C